VDIFDNNWLVLAFLAPFLWAWVNVLDNYFVDGVYEDAYDGALISGLFQLLPWIGVLFGFVSFEVSLWQWSLLSVISGACFSLSMFFYFKTLFTTNDTVLTQALWNISLLLVPFFAWIVLDERLNTSHYFGIGLAFLGASLLIGDYHFARRGETKKIMLWMGLSVLFLSLTMVLSKQAYIGAETFWPIYLFFSLGGAIGSFGLLLTDRKPIRERLVSIYSLSKKFFWIFLLAEFFQLIGTLTSQRAIDFSPSPSFVAVAESFLPIFVILASFFLVWVFPTVIKTSLKEVYQEQLSSLPIKILAITLMSFGIYFIT
jgi:uncharacterized membrane protein